VTLDELARWFDPNTPVGTASLWVVVAVLGILSWLISRALLLKGLVPILHRTDAKWDDALLHRGVFDRISYLAPAIVFYYATYFLASKAEPVIVRLISAYALVVFMLVVGATLSAANDIYSATKMAKDLPIKGYLQIVKLLVYLTSTIVVFAVLFDKSPWAFLSGVGAATAVLVLVFKDTLLGFVASIQIASNDLLRLGDWIEMPKFDANGEIIDIALHTVKVQNFDLTITTIPTFKLIEEPFKNWRSMRQKGARRIKRALHLDQNSIHFADDALLDRLQKIQLISEYVRTRREEIARYNKDRAIDPASPVNGRRMTNIGTFRAYLAAYLAAHPRIRQDMPLIVRQLDPAPTGLPIELYAYTSETEGVPFEGVQSDIFDHVLAAVSEFELRVFQSPTGHDVRPRT
jgi:miniconductance mechanosensitive channel